MGWLVAGTLNDIYNTPNILRKTAIEFVLAHCRKGPRAFDICVCQGNHQRWNHPASKQSIIIVGQWIGSWVAGRIITPKDTWETITSVSPEELILGGYGQYVLIHLDVNQARIYSSKNMFPLYWGRKRDCEEWIFGSEPAMVQQAIPGSISLKPLEVALQTEFYGGPFQTIVQGIELLSWGQRLAINEHGSIDQAYLPALLAANRPEFQNGPSEEMSYLDPCIEVLKASGCGVTLWLSGGIDSGVLLLKLLRAGIPIETVVTIQRCGRRLSALNELVESKQVADLLGLRRYVVVMNTDEDSVFEAGRYTGWHWGYSYGAGMEQFEKNSGLTAGYVLTGTADTLWGVLNSGYALLGKHLLRNPLKHLAQGWSKLHLTHRWLESIVQRSALSDPSCATGQWHPLLDIALNRAPSTVYRAGAFTTLPEMEADLLDYVKRSVMTRLFAGVKRVESAEQFMEMARLLRFYQYFGGRAPRERFIVDPYVDAISWFSLKTYGIREVLRGKRFAYKYFRDKTGRDYHRCVSRINGDVYRRLFWLENRYLTLAWRELGQTASVRGCSFGLTASQWFQSDKFQQFLRGVVTGDVLLIDLLEPGPVRRYYTQLVEKLREGHYTYPGNTQPVKVVRFLRLEMFLRAVLNGDS